MRFVLGPFSRLRELRRKGRRRVRTALAIVLTIAGSASAFAMQAAPPPPAAQSQPPAQKPAAEDAPDNYSYHADGRRDPFINLLGTGVEPLSVARKGDGPASMLVSEIAVSGIMQSHDALVAMIAGPDKRTYVVHAGDKLLDGVIKNVTPQGLVITQRVTDALSQVKQREVRKLLRSLEDAKQ
jgi:Tfp pilus assembly protein PilP